MRKLIAVLAALYCGVAGAQILFGILSQTPAAGGGPVAVSVVLGDNAGSRCLSPCTAVSYNFTDTNSPTAVAVDIQLSGFIPTITSVQFGTTGGAGGTAMTLKASNASYNFLRSYIYVIDSSTATLNGTHEITVTAGGITLDWIDTNTVSFTGSKTNNPVGTHFAAAIDTTGASSTASVTCTSVANAQVMNSVYTGSGSGSVTFPDSTSQWNYTPASFNARFSGSTVAESSTSMTVTRGLSSAGTWLSNCISVEP